MCVESCVSDKEHRMNEKTNLSSTHWGVNHPSRAGFLPDMPRCDVAVGSEHTEEWSGTTFLLRCSCSLFREHEVRCIELSIYTRVYPLCFPSKCNSFCVFRHSKSLELCLLLGLRVRRLLSRFSFELCRVPPSSRRVFPLQSLSDYVGGRGRQLRILVL